MPKRSPRMDRQNVWADDRERAALSHENSGNKPQRRGAIKGRWLRGQQRSKGGKK